MSLENPTISTLENPLSFDELMEIVKNGKYNQANFQPLTICHLSQTDDLQDSKIEIVKILHKNNPTKDPKYLLSGSCPIWKILTNKRVIVKDGKNYLLNAILDETQKSQIKTLCALVLKRDYKA